MAIVSKEITGLESGTSYDASVTARGDGSVYSNSEETRISFTTLNKLPVPVDFEIDETNGVHNKTSTAITFRWHEETLDNKYFIEYQTVGREAQTINITSYQTKTINDQLYGYYEITNLTPGTTYSVKFKRLSTSESDEESEFTEPLAATTKTPIPIDAPSNFDMRDTKLIVRWNDHANAISYVCKAKLNDEVVETVSTDGSPAEFVQLSEGSSYTFTLQAFASPSDNDYCDSEEVVSSLVLYDVSNLPSPEIFRVTDATDSTISLEWSAVDGATGYSLMFREEGGEYEPLSNFNQSGSTFTRTVINLDPYTLYEFQLIALGNGDTVQDSLPTVISHRTLASKLPTPEAFTYAYDLVDDKRINQTTANSIKYVWEMGAFDSSELANERQYEIEIGQTGGATSVLKVTHTVVPGDNNEYSAAAKITNLLSGMEYKARIRSLAVSEAELNSDWSDYTTVSTRSPLETPFNAEFLMRVSDLKLSWGAVNNAASYRAVAKDQQGTELETLTPTVPAAVFTSLALNETYDFEIVAEPDKFDNAHCDSWGYTIDNKLYCVPRLPLPDTFRYDATDNSITVEWSEVPYAESYSIKFCRSGAASYVDVTNIAQYASGEKEGMYYATLTNLEALTTYDFQLVVKGDGESYLDSETGTLSATTGRTPAVPLATPSDFNVQAKDENGLDADYLSYNFVRLMWSPIDHSVGYRVRYRKTASDDWEKAITNYSVYAAGFNIDKCYLEIQSLDSLTNYTFDIIAIGDNVDYLNSTPTTITATTDRAPAVPLDAPQDFGLAEIDWKSATLTWSPIEHATGYRLRYKKSADQAWATKTEFSLANGLCSSEVAGLVAETQYDFELTAVGDSLDYTDSDAVAINGTTLATPKLAAPEIFRAKDITEDSATLEWSSVPDATGYRLRYRTGSGVWTTTTTHSRVRAEVEWNNTISKLRSNTTYECELIAIGNGADLLDSDPAQLTFATLIDSDLQPTTLSATVVKGGFYCQWEPVNGANSYVLAYFDAEGEENILDSIRLGGSETYWVTSVLQTDPDQNGLVAIYPSVLPTNGTGNEHKPWSNFVSVRDTGVVPELLPPTNVRVVGATTSVISLEWEPAFGATSYVVKCGTHTTATPNTFVDLTGLLADTEYAIQVKSCSTQPFFDVGESAYGAEVIARTAQRNLEKLETPNIRLAKKTDSSLEINWEQIEHASGYKIFYKASGDTNPATKLTEFQVYGSGTNRGKAYVVISGLNANTEYQIEAVAVGDAVDYQDSDRAQLVATTDRSPAIALSTPTGLVCVDKTRNTISVEWNSVDNATGYVVSYGNKTVAVTETSALLTGLSGGRTYAIKVKATGDGLVYSDSSYTEAIRVETEADPVPAKERSTRLGYIRRGRLVSIKPGEVIPKGTALKQGALVGVINHTRNDEDQFGSLELDGFYNIPLANGASFALGDLVCIDDEGNAATSGTKFGFAVEATNAKSKKVKARLVTWLDAIE